MNARVSAARVVAQVSGQGRSLDAALDPVLAGTDSRERALLQELCYGTLRWYDALNRLLGKLLDKPLRAREQTVRALLLVGLYQLFYLRQPPYAVVSSTVAAARTLGKRWATGLVNAVLRNGQRRHAELLAELQRDPAHPSWLLERLRQDWPEHWQTIVAANNSRAPLALRVNTARIDRKAYRQRLLHAGIEAEPIAHTATGLSISPRPVSELPGFSAGLASVQDGAAQLSAGLLDLQPGLRVLDACAAPGGKTCHILETRPDLALLALDRDPTRLQRLSDNLDRLGLNAELRCADAGDPDDWWDGHAFDRILLDAPCSGSGVIRRHPDIKLLRRASDIAALADRQYALLVALWPLLKPGGQLLYVTCSVLQQENCAVVTRFTTTHGDADCLPMRTRWGEAQSSGRQILPGADGMDGFYYARLAKTH